MELQWGYNGGERGCGTTKHEEEDEDESNEEFDKQQQL